MSVARDNVVSQPSANNTDESGDFSFDIAPVGTARGILVFIGQVESADDTVNGVTADGSALSRIATAADATTEPCRAYAYFLGSSVPTGTLTIAVDVTVTGAAEQYHAYAITLTAGDDIEVEDTSIVEDNVDDPTPAMTTGASQETYGIGYLVSGLGVNTNITAGTGFTKQGGHDFSPSWSNALIDIDTNDAGGGFNIPFVTSASDDVACIGVALKEAAGAPAASKPKTLLTLGVG